MSFSSRGRLGLDPSGGRTKILEGGGQIWSRYRLSGSDTLTGSPLESFRDGLESFRLFQILNKNFSWKNNDQFVIIFKHYKFNGTLGHGVKFR